MVLRQSVIITPDDITFGGTFIKSPFINLAGVETLSNLNRNTRILHAENGTEFNCFPVPSTRTPVPPLTPQKMEEENRAKAHAEARANAQAEVQDRREELIRRQDTDDIINWLRNDPRIADPRRVAAWKCDFSVVDLPVLRARHDALAIYVQNGVIPSQNLAAAYNAFMQATATVPYAVPLDSPSSWTRKRATSPACANVPLCGWQICVPGPRWTEKGWPDTPRSCNPLSPMCSPTGAIAQPGR